MRNKVKQRPCYDFLYFWFDNMSLEGFIVHHKESQVRTSKLRGTPVPEDCFHCSKQSSS